MSLRSWQRVSIPLGSAISSVVGSCVVASVCVYMKDLSDVKKGVATSMDRALISFLAVFCFDFLQGSFVLVG